MCSTLVSTGRDGRISTMIRPRMVLLALLFSFSSAVAADHEPELSKTPMTSDQIAVYRAFLISYSNGSNSKQFNLANRTVPL